MAKRTRSYKRRSSRKSSHRVKRHTRKSSRRKVVRKHKSKRSRRQRGGFSISSLKNIDKNKVVSSKAFKTFKSGVGKLNDYLNKQEAVLGTTAAISSTPTPAVANVVQSGVISTPKVSTTKSFKKIPTYSTPKYAKNYVSPYKQVVKKK